MQIARRTARSTLGSAPPADRTPSTGAARGNKRGPAGLRPAERAPEPVGRASSAESARPLTLTYRAVGSRLGRARGSRHQPSLSWGCAAARWTRGESGTANAWATHRAPACARGAIFGTSHRRVSPARLSHGCTRTDPLRACTAAATFSYGLRLFVLSFAPPLPGDVSVGVRRPHNSRLRAGRRATGWAPGEPSVCRAQELGAAVAHIHCPVPPLPRGGGGMASQGQQICSPSHRACASPRLQHTDGVKEQPVPLCSAQGHEAATSCTRCSGAQLAPHLSEVTAQQVNHHWQTAIAVQSSGQEHSWQSIRRRRSWRQSPI